MFCGRSKWRCYDKRRNFGTLFVHLQLHLHLESCQPQLLLHLKCKTIPFCRIRRIVHLCYYFYLSNMKLYCILLIKMIQPIVGEFCKTSLKPIILFKHYSCWTSSTFYAWRKVLQLLNYVQHQIINYIFRHGRRNCVRKDNSAHYAECFSCKLWEFCAINHQPRELAYFWQVGGKVGTWGAMQRNKI